MKIKGIKRGKTIEILEEINVADGQEIIIEIPEVQLISEEERRKQLDEVFGHGKDVAKIADSFQDDESKEIVISKSEFWQALEKFRHETNIEEVGIEAEIFAGVRDSSPGREVIW